MNRHYKEGYTRICTNDINNVEQMLQEYDPDLYIMWNPHNNTWLIMDGQLEIAIMKIPQIGFETLDARVYRRIRQIHQPGFAAWEMREAEKQRERDQQRFIDEFAHEFAKDSKQAFINAYDYGRTDGVSKYVNGV